MKKFHFVTQKFVNLTFDNLYIVYKSVGFKR